MSRPWPEVVETVDLGVCLKSFLGCSIMAVNEERERSATEEEERGESKAAVAGCGSGGAGGGGVKW